MLSKIATHIQYFSFLFPYQDHKHAFKHFEEDFLVFCIFFYCQVCMHLLKCYTAAGSMSDVYVQLFTFKCVSNANCYYE
jgi:hypothetical protein